MYKARFLEADELQNSEWMPNALCRTSEMPGPGAQKPLQVLHLKAAAACLQGRRQSPWLSFPSLPPES